jgi:hypothetical protein
MVAIKLNYFPGRGEGSSSGNSANSRGSGQEQQDINVSNPQRGDEWNNYQTRELGADAERNISEEEVREAFNEEDE